jgi:hypothetical protein
MRVDSSLPTCQNRFIETIFGLPLVFNFVRDTILLASTVLDLKSWERLTYFHESNESLITFDVLFWDLEHCA